MQITNETDLIRHLADSQRSGARSIDATALHWIDRASAYRIQAATISALGETVGMLKTAIQPDGVGVAAPIHASRVRRGADARFAADQVPGLEVEIGLRLASDIPNDASVDEALVVAAVDHYFVGIEVIGTRYADRTKASPAAGLADNMSALGYVIGPRYARGTDIEGVTVSLHHNGTELHAAAAKHGFGSVLASLVAYARAQQPGMLLTAGTLVTTGTLCGLIPTSGAGRAVARVGDDIVELDLL